MNKFFTFKNLQVGGGGGEEKESFCVYLVRLRQSKCQGHSLSQFDPIRNTCWFVWRHQFIPDASCECPVEGHSCGTDKSVSGYEVKEVFELCDRSDPTILKDRNDSYRSNYVTNFELMGWLRGWNSNMQTKEFLNQYDFFENIDIHSLLLISVFIHTFIHSFVHSFFN